jgi:LmbE family N-acetylglucosaminyl deacetylase
MKPRLLIAYAHPDDESFGLGGAIAKWVDDGAEVYLICATNGERGTVPPEMLQGYASIADLRLAELDCAVKQLRIKEVFKLGYKDSGMMGSPTCFDTECLWQADVEAVTRRCVEVMRDVQPHVVVTFNKFGGYGHPDHIAIQRAATKAFYLAGDAGYVTGQPTYQPQKLYYSSIPKRQLQLGIAMLRLRGIDPRKLGRNQDLDLIEILQNVEPTHTNLDVSRYFKEWDEANQCHQSQLGGSPTWRMPLALSRWFAPHQGFTRVVPAPARNRVDETDLFAGVKLDERRSLQAAAD